jgi:hypothetical protein
LGYADLCRADQIVSDYCPLITDLRASVVNSF